MRFGLEEKTLAKLNSIFARHKNIDKVLIYGSRAKGTWKAGSDIDLVLQGQNVTLSCLHTLNQEIDDLLLPYTVDTTLDHLITNEGLRDHINRIGHVLYTRGESDPP